MGVITAIEKNNQLRQETTINTKTKIDETMRTRFTVSKYLPTNYYKEENSNVSMERSSRHHPHPIITVNITY